MRSTKIGIGSVAVLVLALTSNALWSRAAAPARIDDAGAPVAQELDGKLTSTGKLTIDGNPAQSGATVRNGSEIATGPDGDCSIDLGPLGRVQIRPNTTVKLMLSPNNCQLLMAKCGSFTQTVPPGVAAQVKMATAKLVDVTVTKGEVWVNHEERGKTHRKSQKSTSTKSINGVNEVNANGESTFTVNCCQCCFIVKEHT